MTESINTDPPETIEPTIDSVAEPGPESGQSLIEMRMGPDNVPYSEYIPLHEISAVVLFEMMANGNEVAARELAWRMDNDPDFGAGKDDSDEES